MKLQRLSTAILLIIEFMLLASARPGLAQSDLNAQLKQALCDQNWGQALTVLDRMKQASGPEYKSQINLYRARVQVFARENVKLSQLMDGCSTPSPAPSTEPTNNPIPPTIPNNIPPGLPNNIPPAPDSNIPPVPGNDLLPVPSL